MKKTAILFLILFFISCKPITEKINFHQESWFLNRLPSNADLYFKLNMEIFKENDYIWKLYRTKEAASFFQKMGISLRFDVKTIYGAVYFFENPVKNVVIMQGIFNKDRISSALKSTHIVFKSHEYVFYKPLTPDNYSLSMDANNRIIIASSDRMKINYPIRNKIMNSLNILKKTERKSDAWFLINKSEKLQDYFKENELLTLSEIDFSSTHYNYFRNTDTIKFHLKFFIKNKRMNNEVLQVLTNIYEKMKIHNIIRDKLHKYVAYNSGNFVEIFFEFSLKEV